MATDSESSSVDTFDMTEGASYGWSGIECVEDRSAYLEISSADIYGEWYCGANLGQVNIQQETDGESIKSNGVIYAAESNPWNFGVVAVSNLGQVNIQQETDGESIK